MSSRAVGDITLVYNDGFIEKRKYRCLADRRNIMAAWSVKYKKQWMRCILLIRPDPESEMVYADGTNFRLKANKSRRTLTHS